MNLPPSWGRMGFSAKAAYLCDTHQVRSYRDACSMLGSRSKKRENARDKPDISKRWDLRDELSLDENCDGV